MKKSILPLTLSLAILGCFADSAKAQILIPNGDFSLGNTNWIVVTGAGTSPAVTFPTGGNPGGYGSLTAAGGWGVLVSPTEAGAVGGGVPIASLSLTAGGPVTFTYDMKNFTAPGQVGGFKWEAWGGNALVGNTGDIRPTMIGDGTTWQTYTYNWTLPVATEKLIFVPLWAGADTIGFDNVGVVPEPSTYALLALGAAGLGGHLIRRRRR